MLASVMSDIPRNIKGRFFVVGFECSSQPYRKEHPVC